MKFRLWYREPRCKGESGPWTTTAPDAVTAEQVMHEWFAECARSNLRGYARVEVTRVLSFEIAPTGDKRITAEAHLRSLRWVTGP